MTINNSQGQPIPDWPMTRRVEDNCDSDWAGGHGCMLVVGHPGDHFCIADDYDEDEASNTYGDFIGQYVCSSASQDSINVYE